MKTRMIQLLTLSVIGLGTPTCLIAQETKRDLPGDATKYYGQRRNQYKDVARRLAKTDLDGDFNYDGVIDNDDPADNGAFQQTPPGLVVGVGEMSQLIVRIRPYRLDFNGQAVVSLQVDGINRASKSGEYASESEEMANMGHIRVWRDASKSQLILDSRDPNRRVFEWTIDDSKFPANVPGVVPRSLYVEGLSTSGEYNGDVRLLLKVQHRKTAATTVSENGKSVVVSDTGSKKTLFKRFGTAYDHILLTVNSSPQRKEIVVKNSGVWISPTREVLPEK
jgi:hypothetical protein